MNNDNHNTADSIGTKVGTAIAKGSKATGKGLAVAAGYTGAYSAKAGKSIWAGLKAAGKAIAKEYNNANTKK